ncbi:hypothetical protein WBG78_29470 [Chryseolinea sp. T2]|uniref:hypothetical protein n=1 Tax=Chryseolinea sp. T2 TaxID=3129255 RepID=UPI003078A168
MTTPKTCPQCNTPFRGRSDKVYCSEGCRSIAKYEKRRAEHLPIKPVNKILSKNRDILRTLWNNQPTNVSRDTLLTHGYQFAYYTTQYITTRAPYYACYDFGFQPRIVNGIKIALVVKMLKISSRDPWTDIDVEYGATKGA